MCQKKFPIWFCFLRSSLSFHCTCTRTIHCPKPDSTKVGSVEGGVFRLFTPDIVTTTTCVKINTAAGTLRGTSKGYGNETKRDRTIH